MGEPVKRRALLLFLGLLLLALPAPAGADLGEHLPGATCTVRVIQLHQGGGQSAGEFDPRLAPLRAQLTAPPFSTWKKVHLLMELELQLPRGGAPMTFVLPGDHEGIVSFVGRVDGPKRRRVRIHLTIKDGAANLMNSNVLLDNGGTYFYAGMKHAGGVLALGLTCSLHPDA